MFLLLEVFTRSLFFADTMIYVGEIQSSLNCPSISRCPQLWGAGHLLWRPLGHVLAGPLLPILNRIVANDDRMAITLLLMLLNDAAMLITALFLYSMLLEIKDTGYVPLLLTAAFLCANASLNTLHSGVPLPNTVSPSDSPSILPSINGGPIHNSFDPLIRADGDTEPSFDIVIAGLHACPVAGR
jgi:hypothetical protein